MQILKRIRTGRPFSPRNSLKYQGLTMSVGSSRIRRLQARNKVTEARAAAVATKAVAYVRVSTEEQATHGFGLESQERSVRAFAESQGYELVELVTDAGISGATRPADRDGFRRVLDHAVAGRCSVLLVHKFDRLARNIQYAVTTVNELANLHQVGIRSVTEPIDTATPMGRTLFAVLAGMAENEREAITERTKGGRLTKATKGGFAGGAAPYGYERDAAGGLRVVDAEAKVVKRVFRMRRQRSPRLTLQHIADQLNGENIASPRGGRWHASTVRYLVDNPKYRGMIEYLFGQGAGAVHVLEQGSHQAII